MTTTTTTEPTGRTDWNRAEYEVDEPKRTMSSIIRELLDEADAREDARLDQGKPMPNGALIYCPFCETDFHRCDFLAHVGSFECGQTLIDRKVYGPRIGRDIVDVQLAVTQSNLTEPPASVGTSSRPESTRS
jgi:hypothetical protein